MIVVDTHAVIWMTQEPKELSARAGEAVLEARSAGALAIADVTLREIAFLTARGRIRLRTPLHEYLDFIESLFRVLPINGKIAERSSRFGDLYPNDPIDQIIGATAIVFGATLVTKDELIRRSGEVNCVW